RPDRAPLPRLEPRAHRPAGEGDHARGAARDDASRRRAGRPADPARGGDLRGRRDGQDLLRRRRARLRQRHSCGGPARDAREFHHLMTDLDTTTLDTLVERLERAAEQLRTGDLSPDAAAGLVEDCAALASQASAELERMARASVQEPAPGQDSLLASQDTLL